MQNRGLQLEPIIIGDDSDSSLEDSPDSAPIEAQDDDTALYTSPAPADLMMMEEGHFGQEDIVQAIRTNSGELLPLNDEIKDSGDVEEVPEEFEVTSQPVVSVRHDGLDMDYRDLGVDELLARAHDWGCNYNSVGNTAFKAWYLAVQLVKDQRALSMWDTPEVARAAIIHHVKRYVQGEIRKEKRWRKRQGLRIGQYACVDSPTIDSAKWSTVAVGGCTPLNLPWTPVAPITISPTTESTNSSEGNNKRKRPSPLPTPNKRKASDSSFHPGPPTSFNPDEVSPRIPKMPRRSNDLLHRPASALLEPTTPPVTPKLNKRSSTTKAADRTAKNVEKQLKKKQARKAEEKQAKKVSSKATQTTPSLSPAASSTSSRTSFPQVVITPKASKKSASPASTKNVAARVSKSGVKKSVSKAKKSESVSPAARPKRQAAIEAEKSFGKTKLVG
jgi:hypothetical protein